MYDLDIDIDLYYLNKLHIDLVEMIDMVDYKLMNKDLMKSQSSQQQMLMKMMK
jgi:hypothetical protein